MSPLKPFTEHPASVGETYGQHLAQASGFGLRMLAGGLACLIHGLLPFLFVRTGSGMISELHRRMVTHRSRLPQATHVGGQEPLQSPERAA